MKMQEIITKSWNNRKIMGSFDDYARSNWSKNLDNFVEELFDFKKPIMLDDASYLTIEDENGNGKRPEEAIYTGMLRKTYLAVDFNPLTNLVRFVLPDGRIASNHIECFKANKHETDIY